ncbi:ATP-binding cassette domain-containing protein [Kutzneria kofuensis]|uniref:ABC-type multidrug transport system ATPase subunit n=1 Tax=Kutzneria kofuensis TaxID=103725 RepID=A0A7W9KB99_9PSEU|nr:ABC transporter ATP-binding protein [Kutzneria kofuensis]MBB5889424.1 ABC-type multidrug transport system ATPase subunit [Kutzneria kofuensis]
MITVDGVWMRYGRGPDVLTGIDVALSPGSVTVVLGENGCGKSTLLRIAAGCTVPTAGSVRGRPSAVSYLPERFPDQLRLSARAYLRHFARIRRLPTRVELLDRLGFAGDLDQPMSELSKGNAQKVGLTQTFGSVDGFLVLDEPWAGLDVAARAVLSDLVREAADAGATVLVTDHTGAAAKLPGATVFRMADGVLRPVEDLGFVEVVVTCTSEAVDQVAKLPGVQSVRRTA